MTEYANVADQISRLEARVKELEESRGRVIELNEVSDMQADIHAYNSGLEAAAKIVVKAQKNAGKQMTAEEFAQAIRATKKGTA